MKSGSPKDKNKRKMGDRPGDRAKTPRERQSFGGGKKPFRKPASNAPEPVSGAESSERIAKRLARAGVASRRDAELMIAEGRVSVNGKVLDSPALNVGPSDRILIDGDPIPAIERTRLWLFHKPAGLITANKDPEGRRTVFDALPKEMPRVISVGRLDFNTEGLLLLTNDGGLARYLELPTTGWLRRYRVRAHGSVTQEQLDMLNDGIAVDGVLYGAIDATLERDQGSNVWISIGLREGKNREVRNVLGALGLEVNRLIRISYGPFQLGDLEPGAVVEIRGRHLRDQLGEKIVAEAGCNFDAPVVNEFSNKPVKGEDGDRGDQRQERRPASAKRRAEEKRGDALDKLDTKKRGFGAAKPFAKEERSLGRKRAPREQDVRRDRSSNVWMAPGARPGSPEREGEEGRKKPKRYGAGTMRPNRGSAPRGERREDGERPKRFEERPHREDRPRRFEDSGPGKDRPQRKRWDETDRDGKPRQDRKPGDKPRGDRKFGDKPYAGKPGGERKFGDKPYTGKPRGERSFGDKPRSERRFEDKPRGDRKFGDKPRGDRKFGDKPYTGWPRGERSSGDRKPGGKSFGGKPGGKSFGGKPGGKGFGGKPGGPKGGGGFKPRGPKRDADRRR